MTVYLRILVTTTLFIATSGQELHLLHYLNQDKNKLIECIENSEYLKDVKKLRGSDFVYTFAEFMSQDLAGTTNKGLNFLNNLIDFFRNQPHDFPSTSSGGFWNDQLIQALRNALVHCSDDYDFKICSNTNHLANRRMIPRYENELDHPEITRFLDLAVTTFPENVCAMTSTPAGFMTLMRFSIDFVNATVRLYNSFHSDANTARVAVREMWEYRIRDREHPVCYYHYDSRDSQVYTCGCSMDTNRYPNITARNKRITTGEVWSILRFFISFSSNDLGDDTFYRYRTEGMRVYERDFEKLLIQKYRVVIFMYWLRLRNVLTEQTEITEDFVNRIPVSVRNILHYSTTYFNQMSKLRKVFSEYGIEDPLEEDVIMHLNTVTSLIAPNVIDNSTSVTSASSTTEKPFYKRLGDNIYKYLMDWCDGNHEGESLACDANSDQQSNLKENKKYYRRDSTYSAYGIDEENFFMETLGFVMDFSFSAGL